MSRRNLYAITVGLGVVIVTSALFWQDSRIIATGVWGLGVIAVWFAVFVKALRQWRAYHDRRALGDVRSDGALLLVAVLAGLAISFALFSNSPEDLLRTLARIFSALSLGAFLTAGFVKLTEAPPDPPPDVEGHSIKGSASRSGR